MLLPEEGECACPITNSVSSPFFRSECDEMLGREILEMRSLYFRQSLVQRFEEMFLRGGKRAPK